MTVSMPIKARSDEKQSLRQDVRRDLEIRALVAQSEGRVKKGGAIGPRQVKLFNQGHRYVAAADYAKGLECFMKVWEQAPDNKDVIVCIAFCLTELGVRDKALDMVARAVELYGEDTMVLMIMGKLAGQMELHETAVKIWQSFVSKDPTNPVGYNNWLSSLYSLDRHSEVIELAQKIIPNFPEDAMLWNVLGAAVQIERSKNQAIPFFREALRLDETCYPAWNNLADALPPYSREQSEANLKCIEIAPGEPEPHVAEAFCCFSRGDLEQGWRHYEYRLSPRRQKRQNALYLINAPVWDGQITGEETLMVVCEQGVGDEILFSMGIKELYGKVGRLLIGVDQRLVALFQRTYPNAQVFGYKDVDYMGRLHRIFPDFDKAEKAGEVKLDAYIPMASIPQHFWKKPADIPTLDDPLVAVDPALSKKWRERLDALGGDVTVGICWTSMNLSFSRRLMYTELEAFLPLFNHPRIRVVSLQYGDVAKTLEAFREKHGVAPETWQDLDLKDDLDDVLALCGELDLVIGPPTAPVIFGLASGSRTRMVNWVVPFWNFGRADDEGYFGYLPNFRVLNALNKRIDLDLHEDANTSRCLQVIQDEVADLMGEPSLDG